MRARVARSGSEPQSSKEQQQQSRSPSEQNNEPDQRLNTQDTADLASGEYRDQLRISSGDRHASSMGQNNSLQQQMGRNQGAMVTWVAPGMNEGQIRQSQDQLPQQQSQNLMQNDNFIFLQHLPHSRNIQNVLYLQQQQGQQEIDHQQQYQQVSQLAYQQQLQTQAPLEHNQYFNHREASFSLDQDALNSATAQHSNNFQYRPQFVNDASASSKSRSRPHHRDIEAMMQQQQRQALEFHYRYHHHQSIANNNENDHRRKEKQAGERWRRSSHSTSGRER